VFSRDSVEGHIEKFMDFLGTSRSGLPDVVSFLIEEFQQILTLVKAGDQGGALSLFLLSLQAAGENESGALADKGWRTRTCQKFALVPEQIEDSLTPMALERGRGIQSRAPVGLQLVPSLVLRHVAGRLFQEAHAVLESAQLGLFGVSKPNLVQNFSPSGAYFTPVPIARLVAEWALSQLAARPDPLVVADFACGSGVFLTEALRALERMQFSGSVRLVGRDDSPQAITMARVAVRSLACDLRGMVVESDISLADARDSNWPKADVVLMNPPFRSWEEMDLPTKVWVRDVMGDVGRGRPDLSAAFIELASRAMRPSGVLAFLIPSGVLASEGLAGWRRRLAERAAPSLVAVLGEHGLFDRALVSVGVVALGGTGAPGWRDAGRLLVAWSSAEPGSASKAIRSIRRSMDGGQIEGPPVPGAWSVAAKSVEAWGRKGSWLPGPDALGDLLFAVQRDTRTTVGDLFHVRQGIRTGSNGAFIHTGAELGRLPKNEKAYLRPVVDSASFKDGVVMATKYVFYPDPAWSTEDDLRGSVPRYYDQFLLPAKSLLSKRNLKDGHWWALTRARGWMFDGRPRLLCKTFGLCPAFATDFDGSFAVVQANAWLPRGALGSDRGSGALREVLAAYWWMLNSRVMFALFREYCPNIAGGQLNLESRFVKSVPLPNLARRLAEDPALRALAAAIRGAGGSGLPEARDRDKFAAAAYGTGLSEWNLTGV